MGKLFVTSLVLLQLSLSGSLFAQEQTKNSEEALCPSALDADTCKTIIKGLTDGLRAKLNSTGDHEQILKDMWSDKNLQVSILNSPFLSNRLETLPVDVTFKVIDIQDGDSVLGMEFQYAKNISRTIYGNGGSREKSYGFDFSLDGTATQDDEKNPRNFINTKLSFSFSNHPNFNEAKAVKSLTKNVFCIEEENIEKLECGTLLADATAGFFDQVGSTFYFDYGIDLTYEADQAFDAHNTLVSAFAIASYEDFRRDSFLGSNSIVPTVRIAVDTVEPSNSPRVLAGDDSSYERFSGEFHLSVPLTKLLNIPYLFSFNYRIYEEIGASEIVEQAGLESYHLRTYSLSDPAGLVVSYSSGRLPFGLEEQQTIEIGFQTYF